MKRKRKGAAEEGSMAGDRGVSIGRHAVGNAITTADHEIVEAHVTATKCEALVHHSATVDVGNAGGSAEAFDRSDRAGRHRVARRRPTGISWLARTTAAGASNAVDEVTYNEAEHPSAVGPELRVTGTNPEYVLRGSSCWHAMTPASTTKKRKS